MLLEVRSWATEALYEEVLPRLERWGFRPCPELGWMDPESDGEYGAVYYDYGSDEPLPGPEVARMLAELEALLGEEGTVSVVSRSGARPRR